MKKLFPFILLASILIAHTVFAISESPIKPPTQISLTQGGAAGVVCLGLQWLFTAAIIFSIVVVLLAAYDYMRSSGDPALVKSATNRLVYVAIGIAVALLARTVPVLIGSVFGAASSGDTSSFCTK